MNRQVYIFLVCALLCSCNEKDEGQKRDPLLWGFALQGFPIEQAQLLKTQEHSGLAPSIIEFYLQWPAKEGEPLLASSTCQAIWRFGAIPCLTWEPRVIEGGSLKDIPYQEILNGQYDTYLLHFAEDLKSWGKPIVIRLAHEMNLKQYHWGTTETQFGSESPAIYIKLFRYIVDFFQKAGVGNVRWAFCPNAGSVPAEPWNSAANYYPGDEYVDILGMDGYDWGDNSTTFEGVFANLYSQLKKISANKPIIVFETSSAGGAKGKESWAGQAAKMASEWGLKGIVWFQVDKEKDWRLENTLNLSDVRQAASVSQPWLESLRSIE